MISDKNESLIEVAIRLMKSKKKPKNMKYITNEVFQFKGIRDCEDIEKLKAQFQLDFMLSGEFICCGEDKNGHKLWDLKGRQPTMLLDKDGAYLEDLYVDDDDVRKNELSDELENEKNSDSDDDDEEEGSDDDIEEELKDIGDVDSIVFDDDEIAIDDDSEDDTLANLDDDIEELS